MNMKKWLIALIVSVTCYGCAQSTTLTENTSQNTNVNSTKVEETKKEEEIHIPVTIKESPDKYTSYVKDYVGKNCATIGYESLGGDRIDRYSNCLIKIKMLTGDGSYVGVSDDELKEYMVVAQNLEPNTEVKVIFEKNSEGEEYDSLTEWQSVNDIILQVKKVGDDSKENDVVLTPIQISQDKYTGYVKDYNGRNLANCGYISMAGDLRDEYSTTNIKLNINAADGSFIELDKETIKQYYVVGQSPEPNTEIKFEFETLSTGEEANWTSWQSISEIELYVKKVEE